jgi:hypothetical protein
LLLLPAVGDNAAMEAEPPQAAQPNHKRRWFQFSLRTLLIVVAVLAVVTGRSKELVPASPHDS